MKQKCRLKSHKEYFAEQEDAFPKSKISQAYSSAGSQGGKSLLKADKIFYKLIDDDTSGVRRLLRTAISRGIFDDEPDLKEDAETLYKQLSTGTFQKASERALDVLSGDKNKVAEPEEIDEN